MRGNRRTGVTPIWYPSEEVDAQAAHAGWGMALFLMVCYWGWGLLGGAMVVVGWAAVKEFVFDIVIEKDTWDSSAVDFAFYLVGAVVGLMVVML